MIARFAGSRGAALFLLLTFTTGAAWPQGANYVYIPTAPTSKAAVHSAALARGIEQYEKALFPDAAISLKMAMAEGLSEQELLMAHECLAYCYLALDDLALARSVFRQLLSLDPSYRPGADAPPKVRELFEEVLLRATVEGVVTSAGRPLSAATVACIRVRSTRTNRNGRFKMVGVPVGEIVLLAYKEGYGAISLVVKTTEEERESVQMELVAAQTASLQGSLLDDKGKPVSETRAFLRSTIPGQPDLVLETDQTGEYRCPYVAVGNYTLNVALEGYRMVMESVSLKAGDRITRNMSLEPVRPPEAKKKGMGGILPAVLGIGLLIGLLGGKGGGGGGGAGPNISGTVLESTTLQALPGIRVRIGSASDTSDANGRYSLSLSQGTYPVSATDPENAFEFDTLQPNTLSVTSTEPMTLDIYMRPVGGSVPPEPPSL